MTEYELISLVIERRTEVVALLQWWASISVGIIAGSQLLERFLNIVLICILVAFYIIFSFATLRLAIAISQQMMKAFEDIATLKEPSAQATLMIQQFASGYIENTGLMLGAVILFVVIATCAYPIWVYNKSGT